MSSNTSCSGLFRQRGYSTSRMASAFSRSKPIENVWDALGRHVAGRNYPPTNKNTLICALTEEWDKLPQQLLDNVVQSLMSRLMLCCIAICDPFLAIVQQCINDKPMESQQHWWSKKLQMRSGSCRPSAPSIVQLSVVCVTSYHAWKEAYLILVGVYEDQELGMKFVRVVRPFYRRLDLMPPDFFLFPQLKLALKGKRFDDVSDIQRNVTSLFNSISNEHFLQSFQDLYSRSQRCIFIGGDYFEGQLGSNRKYFIYVNVTELFTELYCPRLYDDDDLALKFALLFY
ncbi:histone-lysine N-methyltransferase SETMAR [Trichonephila clavipes]|nr:histone-lysine N-methyltransferase SETMAR [Trichonephila clavipes]